MITAKKKVVVIGGGTGTTAVLTGLRAHENLDISVVVSMADDGGSNAVIRDEFGLLPLSDARKSVIALADDSNDLLREIFTYRFHQGQGLIGHTLGNLIMLGLSELVGSESNAIEAVSKLFGVRGRVLPVTLAPSNLTALYDDGTYVASEHLIDEPEIKSDRKITALLLNPPVKASADAVQAIVEADYIVAGPGDLYTTTLANIVVPGIAESIKNSPAKFIFVSNLMTKKGQTHWMKASDLVNEVEKYAGRRPDIVFSHAGSFPVEVLAHYRAQGEHPLEDDLDDVGELDVMRADLISDMVAVPTPGDTLVRSLIRHDSQKLKAVLENLFI